MIGVSYNTHQRLTSPPASKEKKKKHTILSFKILSITLVFWIMDMKFGCNHPNSKNCAAD